MASSTPTRGGGGRKSRGGGGGAATAATAAALPLSQQLDLEVWVAPELVPPSLLSRAHKAFADYEAGREERVRTMDLAAREAAAAAAGEDDDKSGGGGRGGGGRRSTRGGNSNGGNSGKQQAAAAAGKKAKESAANGAAETYRQRWVALGDAAVAGFWRYGAGARHALPPSAQAQLLALVSDRPLHGDGGALAGRAAALLSACLAAHPPAVLVPASAVDDDVVAMATDGGAGGGEQEDGGKGGATTTAAAARRSLHLGLAHVRVNPVVWTPLGLQATGMGGAGAGDDDEDGDMGPGGGIGTTRGALARDAAAVAARLQQQHQGISAGGFAFLFRLVEEALHAAIAAKGGAAAATALGLPNADSFAPAAGAGGAVTAAAAAAAAAGGGGGGAGVAPDSGVVAMTLGHALDVLQVDLSARLAAWQAAHAAEVGAAGAAAQQDVEMAEGGEEGAGGQQQQAPSRRAGGRAGRTGGGGAAAGSAFSPRRAAAARLLLHSLLWRLLRDEQAWAGERAKDHLVRNLLMLLALGSGEMDAALPQSGGGGASSAAADAASTDAAVLASLASRLLRMLFDLLSAVEASGLYSNAFAELPSAVRTGGNAAAVAAAAAATAAAEAGGADSAAAVAASAAAAAAAAAASAAAATLPNAHGNDRAQLDRALLEACVAGSSVLLPFRSLPHVRAAALRALPPIDRARLAAAAIAEAHRRSDAPADARSAAERERARLQAVRLAVLEGLHAYHSDRGRGAETYLALPGLGAGGASGGGAVGLGGGVAGLASSPAFAAVVDAAAWRVASDTVWATRGLGSAPGVAVLLGALLSVGGGEPGGGAGGKRGALLAAGGGGGGSGSDPDDDNDVAARGDLCSRAKAALGGTASLEEHPELAAGLAAVLARAVA
jgi:hypothetical protein